MWSSSYSPATRGQPRISPAARPAAASAAICRTVRRSRRIMSCTHFSSATMASPRGSRGLGAWVSATATTGTRPVA